MSYDLKAAAERARAAGLHDAHIRIPVGLYPPKHWRFSLSNGENDEYR